MKHLKLSLLFLLCVLMAVPVSAKRKTKVIAHRGYWKTEGAAQNSIRSLERANEIKVYGSEFDVHLTADNVPVVYHDRKIEGKDIQTASYAELKDLKLSNGETLPTLEQYLDRAKKLKKTKLIFELKSHATPLRDREAAKIVVDMVNDETHRIYRFQFGSRKGASPSVPEDSSLLPERRLVSETVERTRFCRSRL